MGVLSMFSSQKWTNKAILNDSKIRDLIEHLSKRKLGNKDYPADLMGDAYEILLKKFADDSKAQAGEFYTPRSVVRLLVHILDPQPGKLYMILLVVVEECLSKLYDICTMILFAVEVYSDKRRMS